MAAFSGTAGSVGYSTGGTIQVGSLSEWSLDVASSPVETTVFGAEWDEFVPTVRSYTGSFSGARDDSSTTQNLMFSARYAVGQSTPLRLANESASWYGTVLITGISPSVDVKGRGDVSYSFTGLLETTYS